MLWLFLHFISAYEWAELDELSICLFNGDVYTKEETCDNIATDFNYTVDTNLILSINDYVNMDVYVFGIVSIKVTQNYCNRLNIYGSSDDACIEITSAMYIGKASFNEIIINSWFFKECGTAIFDQSFFGRSMNIHGRIDYATADEASAVTFGNTKFATHLTLEVETVSVIKFENLVVLVTKPSFSFKVETLTGIRIKNPIETLVIDGEKSSMKSELTIEFLAESPITYITLGDVSMFTMGSFINLHGKQKFIITPELKAGDTWIYCNDKIMADQIMGFDNCISFVGKGYGSCDGISAVGTMFPPTLSDEEKTWVFAVPSSPPLGYDFQSFGKNTVKLISTTTFPININAVSHNTELYLQKSHICFLFKGLFYVHKMYIDDSDFVFDISTAKLVVGTLYINCDFLNNIDWLFFFAKIININMNVIGVDFFANHFTFFTQENEVVSLSYQPGVQWKLQTAASQVYFDKHINQRVQPISLGFTKFATVVFRGDWSPYSIYPNTCFSFTGIDYEKILLRDTMGINWINVSGERVNTPLITGYHRCYSVFTQYSHSCDNMLLKEAPNGDEPYVIAVNSDYTIKNELDGINNAIIRYPCPQVIEEQRFTLSAFHLPSTCAIENINLNPMHDMKFESLRITNAFVLGNKNIETKKLTIDGSDFQILDFVSAESLELDIVSRVYIDLQPNFVGVDDDVFKLSNVTKNITLKIEKTAHLTVNINSLLDYLPVTIDLRNNAENVSLRVNASEGICNTENKPIHVLMNESYTLTYRTNETKTCLNSEDETEPKEDLDSTHLIILVVFACVAGIGLICGVVFLVRWKMKKDQEKKTAEFELFEAFDDAPAPLFTPEMLSRLNKPLFTEENR